MNEFILTMIHILAVSDEKKELQKEGHKNIDLLVNCGDLEPGYLEYLINEFNPCFSVMVYGNHDEKYFKENETPEKGFSQKYKGTFIVNNQIINIKKCIHKELTIAGFPGVPSYGKKPFHFKEKDVMPFKIKLQINQLLGTRLDVIISHAQPYIEEVFKEKDYYHQPSKKFGEIYNLYFPSIWLYGHVHPCQFRDCFDVKLTRKNKQSYILNAVPYKFITYDEITKTVVDVYPLHNKIS